MATICTPAKFTTNERIDAIILDGQLDKYKNISVSVAIEGSTAIGIDAPESNLELRVLLQKKIIQIYSQTKSHHTY
jgi:kanamycin nucleotidyltransferase